MKIPKLKPWKYLRSQIYDFKCNTCGHKYSTSGWGQCPNCKGLLNEPIKPTKK